MKFSPLALTRHDGQRRETPADKAAARAAADRRRRIAARIRMTVLEPSDEHHLAALFDRLSPRSRYLRYLAPIRTLPPRSLRHLAAVDHVRHEAIGAFDGDILVGTAHYFRSVDDPRSAEIAIEVADDYHGAGIATGLLRELGRLAHERDIIRLTATALRENPAILPLLRGLGWPLSTQTVGSQLELGLLLAA